MNTPRASAEPAPFSERKYRVLADVLGDAVYDWDLVADTVEWNAAMFQLFRYDPANVDSSSQWWVDRVHPDDRPMVMQQIHGVFDRLDARWVCEYRFQYGDGSYGIVIDRGAVMYDDGKPIRMIGGMTDVTEQRRLAEELRNAQKMEAVGQLAAGIAHDFNNVLTAIFGYANLMRDGIADEHLLGELSEIERAAERAARLTQQLLAFARQQVLQVEVVDVNDVLTSVGRLLERIIGEHIRIEYRLAAALPVIRADRGQLEQVLVNLAVNARDAMPEGGLITVSTSAESVAGPHADQSMPAGDYVRLSVQDYGTGMDAKVQARIFEPFFTTKVRGQGTGLGLATVYGIVRQSGGYIAVNSRVGEGTRFDILFPAERGAAAPASQLRPAAAMTPARTPSGTTILLVEDEDAVRHLLRDVLKRNAYVVIEARDGEEGVRVVQERTGDIDLLLTDVVMPGLSGLAVAAALTGTGSKAPVLFMSGYSHEFAATAPGPGTVLLQKPFTPAQLLEAVHDALDLRKA